MIGTAAIARANFERAGGTDRIELIVGAAAESVNKFVDDRVEPFDLVFIDADKPNNPRYLEAALKLSRPGTVIIGDNVVRNGAVAEPASTDPRVQGTWADSPLQSSEVPTDSSALRSVPGHRSATASWFVGWG